MNVCILGVVQCMAEAKRLGLQCYVESAGGVSAATAMAGGVAVEDVADEEDDSLQEQDNDEQ